MRPTVVKLVRHFVPVSALTTGLLIASNVAQAQSCSWTTLTNGTTADASQVMGNFNCLAPLHNPHFTGNIGIGNSSPAEPFVIGTDIAGGSSWTASINGANNSLNGLLISAGANASQYPLILTNYSGTNIFNVNALGNASLGSSIPVSVYAGSNLLQLGSQMELQSVVGNQVLLGNNIRHDPSGYWTTITTDYATGLRQYYGGFYFHAHGSVSGGTNLSSTWDTSDVKMAILNGGNVGIGTTSPTTNNGGTIGKILEVAGTGNENTVVDISSGATSGSSQGGILEFRSSASLSGGDAWLGQLHVIRDADVTSGKISSHMSMFVNNDGTVTEAEHISANGNVGIGTASPSYTLHVNGSVAGTSAYNNLSDRRLKKDIRPIQDALSIVDQLQGVRFNWRSVTERSIGKGASLPIGTPQVGFIAQDVQKVLPEAISVANDNDRTLSVAESKVVPVLVEAVKELGAANRKQAAQIYRLDAAGLGGSANAIKELNAKLKAKDAQIAQLQEKLENDARQNALIISRLERLEQRRNMKTAAR